MFLAYANFEATNRNKGKSAKALLRKGIDKGTKESRKDLSRNNLQTSKRYKAGQAPSWAAFDDSDDDDLATRYRDATSNEPRYRPKERPKYEMPTGKIVPRNHRHIRIPEIVKQEDRDQSERRRDDDRDKEKRIGRDDDDRERRRDRVDHRDRRRSRSRDTDQKQRLTDNDYRHRHKSTASDKAERELQELEEKYERRQRERLRHSRPEIIEHDDRPSLRRERIEDSSSSRRSRREEIAKPKIIEHEDRSSSPDRSDDRSGRRRQSSSSSEPGLDLRGASRRNVDRQPDRKPRRRIPVPTAVVDDHTASLANYNPVDGASIRQATIGRRRHASSSSSDDEIPSATTFGGKEATLEPAELDEDGMISRRARLLAGRQAKKEYIEYKDQHKKEIKKTHGYAISSDSDEKDKSENEALAIESEESEANESEESEVESSESDDIVPKMKPIFTKKKDRLTLEDDEDVAQRNAEIEERAEKAGDDRRSWTLNLVNKEMEREKLDKDYKDTKISIKSIATALAQLNTDDEDEEQSFSRWKTREFSRLKREKAAHDEEMAKEEDRARRAEMDQSELEAEAYERRQKAGPQKERQTQKFLQRYFHKGVFFQDDDELVEKLKVRAAAPTMDDKFDRSVLPEIMQTKYFGKRSQQKHTHLSKEDTSRQDAWGRGREDKRGKVFNQPKKPR